MPDGLLSFLDVGRSRRGASAGIWHLFLEPFKSYFVFSLKFEDLVLKIGHINSYQANRIRNDDLKKTAVKVKEAHG